MGGVRLVLACLLLAAPAAALPPELVTVGAPGNEGDPGNNGYGAVDYVFEIGRTEVTNREYAAFLNAVAADDPHALWVPSQGSHASGGIVRSGTAGSYVYTVKPGFEDKPVLFVSFLSAARFANWLHHGMPSGPAAAARIESGSYDLAAEDPEERLPGASWVIPDRHEWSKAAYYYPGSALAPPHWFAYATGADVLPTPATCSETGAVTNPGSNVAVYGQTCNWNGSTTGNVADVGTAGNPSAFGTYDQTGNALELVARAEYPGVLLLGGGAASDASGLARTWAAGTANDNANGLYGFRVARVPEPGGAAGPAAALLTLAALRTRRRAPRRRPAPRSPVQPPAPASSSMRAASRGAMPSSSCLKKTNTSSHPQAASSATQARRAPSS